MSTVFSTPSTLPLPRMQAAIAELEKESAQKHDQDTMARLQRGLRQVAQLWREEDGDATAFSEFVRGNFVADQAGLDTLFSRFEDMLEQLDGHLHEARREMRQQLDLDRGPILPFDELFGSYDPSAHVLDDFFRNKLAFIVLLNFPLTTLEERLRWGKSWDRRQWAETRLAQRFERRIPAEVQLALARADAEAGQYVSEYNIWMHHLIDNHGQRLFPEKLRLLSHWGLRDQLKADYTDKELGLARQRLIQKVMERIVTQTVPQAVINNPGVDWLPYTNEVRPSTVKDFPSDVATRSTSDNSPEPNTRFIQWLKTFHAARKVDPHSPATPTLIARRFNEDREIPEQRVQAMLEQVLTSPLAARVAKLIEARLGRPLEPFDIWYSGFRAGAQLDESELDDTVRKKYPSAKAFADDMPALLAKLGFSQERARYLSDRIVVDAGRGAGHAMGAAMRAGKAHLRTRVGKDGMTYKGFNVAAHELGHNVEQVLSLSAIDHISLQGVPNTAFTEAFAFLFQGKDLELLGLPAPDADAEALQTLGAFWLTFEIAGVSLVDMAMWHWMYDHPQATPEEMKHAVVETAKKIWDRHYAPFFGVKDVVLLGIYSHMVDSFLYLPDYPIGHLISFQIEEQMRKAGSIGPEFERMATMGRITPDLWMERATGRPVGAEALLEATERALTKMEAGEL